MMIMKPPPPPSRERERERERKSLIRDKNRSPLHDDGNIIVLGKEVLLDS